MRTAMPRPLMTRANCTTQSRSIPYTDSKRLMRRKSLMAMGLVGLTSLLMACGNKSASFDLLAEDATFSQSAAEVNGKIDVLWVIDNSGSMATSQQALVDNFQSFINRFDANGFDYQIAVTVTDAYKDDYNATNLSEFRSGIPGTSNSGYKIITPSTPDKQSVFVTNAKQGINGSGDERAFQSIRSALNNPLNGGFPRSDAFLAIIVVSDEDDSSWDGSSAIGYTTNDPRLHTPESYVTYLDGKTNSTAQNRRYNVSSIAVIDSTCGNALGGRPVASRYRALTELTNGRLGSLCDNFGTTLASISNKIIELSTQFYLDREPAPGTLRIFVNGVEIFENSTNGYSYNASTNSVSFHGSAVPPAGAQIRVTYDPIALR
ncbi:MAG TPA: hypothetical protein PLZ57_06220 [Pseudobdellovibrionaceae bacterium]|nr:hypothetical protein [Pseudobdellovibrionaceae bacterium]